VVIKSDKTTSMYLEDNRKWDIANLLKVLMALKVIDKVEIKVTLNSVNVRRR